MLIEPPVFSEVRGTRSLVLCVCFVGRCLSFCLFPFGHCVVCSSSFYGFWLPLWYLQTRLNGILINLPDKQYVVRTSILARRAPTACQWTGRDYYGRLFRLITRQIPPSIKVDKQVKVKTINKHDIDEANIILNIWNDRLTHVKLITLPLFKNSWST